MKYSKVLENNVIEKFIADRIREYLDSHRSTPYYQLEIQPWDDFLYETLEDSLEEGHEHLQEQLDFISLNLVWPERLKEIIDSNVQLLPCEIIMDKKLVHFKFAIPLFLPNENLLFSQEVYQNNYGQDLNGSIAIEMYKFRHNKFEYVSHLFGMGWH